jgi:hypothetical protein
MANKAMSVKIAWAASVSATITLLNDHKKKNFTESKNVLCCSLRADLGKGELGPDP